MRNKGNADIHRIHAGIRGVKKLDASAFGSVNAWEGDVFRRVFGCDGRGGGSIWGDGDVQEMVSSFALCLGWLEMG